MLIKYKQKRPFVALVNFPSMVLINPDIAQSQAINLCLFPTALNGWIIEQELERKMYMHTHTNTSAGTFENRIHTILLLIIWWAWDWCLVLMWTGETVWCLLQYQALNYGIRLPEECKQCLSQGVRVWLFSMGLLAPVGRHCNCITWSNKTAGSLSFIFEGEGEETHFKMLFSNSVIQ